MCALEAERVVQFASFVLRIGNCDCLRSPNSSRESNRNNELMAYLFATTFFDAALLCLMSIDKRKHIHRSIKQNERMDLYVAGKNRAGRLANYRFNCCLFVCLFVSISERVTFQCTSFVTDVPIVDRLRVPLCRCRG